MIDSKQDDPILKRVYVIKNNVNYIEENDKISIVFINNKKIQKIFRKLGKKIPTESYLELDEYSSIVFKNIDGNKNLYEIGQILKDKATGDVEPLYERLVTFVDYLDKTRRWIELNE